MEYIKYTLYWCVTHSFSSLFCARVLKFKTVASIDTHCWIPVLCFYSFICQLRKRTAIFRGNHLILAYFILRQCLSAMCKQRGKTSIQFIGRNIDWNYVFFRLPLRKRNHCSSHSIESWKSIYLWNVNAMWHTWTIKQKKCQFVEYWSTLNASNNTLPAYITKSESKIHRRENAKIT